jgi:hypothetical protein
VRSALVQPPPIRTGEGCPISAIVQRDQLGDAGGALATFDFDHDVIVDPQPIGGTSSASAMLVRPLMREPAGTGER